jgi:hypothetical protein
VEPKRGRDSREEEEEETGTWVKARYAIGAIRD